MLILARVLQAVAGATLMPSTLALITELFGDEKQRGQAIAAWAATQFAFASFGPVIGGVMLHQWWWGSVFLIAVPVGLVVLVLGPRWLPEHVDPAAAQRVDGLGAGLLVAALACVFVVIKAAIPGAGAPVALVVAAGVGALVAGTGFVRRQLTAEAPLLDLRVLATPVVAGTIGSLTLAAVVLAGTGFWATQYLQSDAGMSPLAAAIAFAPMGLGIAAGTQVAGGRFRRRGPRRDGKPPGFGGRHRPARDRRAARGTPHGDRERHARGGLSPRRAGRRRRAGALRRSDGRRDRRGGAPGAGSGGLGLRGGAVRSVEFGSSGGEESVPPTDTPHTTRHGPGPSGGHQVVDQKQ